MSEIVLPESTESGARCVELMTKVFEGQFLCLPEFAQELITFLYDGVPLNAHPRVVANHIATRGMVILSKAHEVGQRHQQIQQQADQQTEQQTEQQRAQQAPSFWRDVIAIATGFCVYEKTFLSAIGGAYLIYTSREYAALFDSWKQLLWIVYVAVWAYFRGDLFF